MYMCLHNLNVSNKKKKKEFLNFFFNKKFNKLNKKILKFLLFDNKKKNKTS